jgi:hypothetical protein
MRVPPDYERQILDLARERGVEPVPIRAPTDGRFVVVICGWHPTRLNQLLEGHWASRQRRKDADADLIAIECLRFGVPRAVGRRRVSLELWMGKGERRGDPDAYWKGLLDGLVRCGVLKDDGPRWVDLGPVTYGRDGHRRTVIVLEDC